MTIDKEQLRKALEHLEPISMTGNEWVVFCAAQTYLTALDEGRVVEWHDVNKTKPPEQTTVLIWNGDLNTYDVVFYNGVNSAGMKEWFMADISYDPRQITHWSLINPPTTERED